MKGIFINLDRCPGRARSLRGQLESSGIGAEKYLRFSAIEPSGDQPQLSRGLKTKGELGLFMSLVNAFMLIGQEDFEDIVHVVEDDATFSAAFAGAVSSISRAMLEVPRLQSADIVFLDYHFNIDLFKDFMRWRNDLTPGSINLISARNSYLACTGSFLVRRSSALRLSGLLADLLDAGNYLVPVDLTLRSFLRMGIVIGFLSVPTLGAPNWELDKVSAIQTHADSSMRLSRRAHLLLRLLAAELKSPYWCGMKLEEMYGIPSPLSPNGDVHDFISFFESLKMIFPGI